MTKPRRSFPPAPTQARALLISAHPFTDSFSHALGLAWAEGARSQGVEVQVLRLAELDFDPALHTAYREDQPLEPDLVQARDAIAQAAHLSIATPLWWSSVPAQLKGFFDRVLLPGWAFRYENDRPVGGLSGRSGRLLMTMDAPTWYDSALNFGAGRRQVAQGVMRFCGIKPTRVSAFGDVRMSSPAQRVQMLEKAQRAGVEDGASVRQRLPSPALESAGRAAS
ncbi:MAG: NAD(P)H-dependent oxidoreductase [Myxococcota bacterium]|nr:NAD(P)H-dependent oxidoreductase [Myxococcota bacterium]